MAVITPNTDVILLKVPLEMDEVNQLTFASKTAQYNYFSSLPKYVIEEGDFTYQRKDNTIRFPAQYDDILQYNYVMYKNTNYSDKWFYAYIVGIEYLNDNVTAIAIKTDVWQTWQFDLTYKPVFVEREHVNDDTFGLHTIPENLETGPISCIRRYTVKPSGDVEDIDGNTHSFLEGAECIVFLVSSFPDEIKPSHWYPLNAKSFTGLGMFAVRDEAAAAGIIKCYQEYSSDQNIESIFMAPIKLFDKGYFEQKTFILHEGDTPITATITIITISDWSYVGLTDMKTYTLDRPSTLAGSYLPRNKKLLCWPYNYFTVSNGVGEIEEYHYEDFTSDTVRFKMYGALSQGCAIKLVPQNLKQVGVIGFNGIAPEYAVSARKLPICAWASDSYTNWLTQNGINTAISIGASTASGLLSAGVGNPFGVLAAGSQIANSIGNVIQASKLPNRAEGDTNMGDWMQGANEYYNVSLQTIRPEYASVLDHYFDMYGYKVNEVKIPNITGRRNWNYVKTIGCYIDADIPQGDLEEIKGMFDRGITFWHNPTTFADYTQNNDII